MTSSPTKRSKVSAGEQPPFERDGLTQAFTEYRHTVEASPVEADDDSNRTLW